MHFIRTTLLSMLLCGTLYAQQPTPAPAPAAEEKKEDKPKPWNEKLSIRGYAQLRYNNLLNTNEDLKCEQCDRGWAPNTGLTFRRARFIVSANPHNRVFLYFQLDAANIVSGTQHYVQIRDLYTDISLTPKGELKLRAGQSKVPFGFENLQSSQNRICLDRSDAINSAVANERDMGLFLHWAPLKIRDRFAYLVKSGLKGSGDYGAVNVGIYNGQIANKPELTAQPHVVARVSWPFLIGEKQILEPGLQAYTGRYSIPKENRSAGVAVADDYLDQRAGAQLVLYPQPFGFMAEAVMGTGPEFSRDQDSIMEQKLVGVSSVFMFRKEIGKQFITPYARGMYYDGGKKHELDARSYTVRELEAGVEWQPFPALELTVAYVFSDRRFEDFAKQDNHQTGRLLRMQLQTNF